MGREQTAPIFREHERRGTLCLGFALVALIIITGVKNRPGEHMLSKPGAGMVYTHCLTELSQ